MSERGSMSGQKIVWIDKISAAYRVIDDISKDPLIAVDSEGFKLGRVGTLDILTIAKRDKTVYLFDITTMGQGVFEGGLRELLEGDKCEKLVFDCRNDADALLHQYQVKLANVLDLQLLDLVHRQAKSPKQPLYVWPLWGYKKCIEEYLKDNELASIKDRGTKEMTQAKDRNKNVWTERPLKESLKQYCAVDTLAMFPLFRVLSSGKDLNSIRAASGRYVDYRRSYPTLPLNASFVFHGFLPHNILSDDGLYRNCECIGCRKMFSRTEFSASQMCRVCKLIKKNIDIKKERERRERDHYLYHDYDNMDSIGWSGGYYSQF